MKENTKNKIILSFALLSVIFFIFLFRSYQDAVKQSRLVNQEMRVRMGLEEKVLNLSNQNENLKTELNQLQEEFNKEKLTVQQEKDAQKKKILELEGKLNTISNLKEKLQ